ncbi:hypothetical protein LZ30DRAFT_252748 [Colletotrichum cereale]|nr:hypothetical protein LZ30DRAFT_252748 [Colletotrichum cereale]
MSGCRNPLAQPFLLFSSFLLLPNFNFLLFCLSLALMVENRWCPSSSMLSFVPMRQTTPLSGQQLRYHVLSTRPPRSRRQATYRYFTQYPGGILVRRCKRHMGIYYSLQVRRYAAAVEGCAVLQRMLPQSSVPTIISCTRISSHGAPPMPSRRAKAREYRRRYKHMELAFRKLYSVSIFRPAGVTHR